MASASEVVLPIGTQKHDPAWKHCLLIRSNERNKLKCLYCMKLFLGGGIHRIKEHLAKQKGNASRCPKVPPEVQDAMQESLDGTAVRKRRKARPTDEIGGEPGLGMIPLTEIFAATGPVDVEVKEDGGVQPLGVAERGRKRKQRVTFGGSPVLAMPVSAVDPVPGKPQLASNVENEQVFMAISRFLFEAGVPLEAVNSPYFQPMVEAIGAAGSGLRLPSYHDFRGWKLKRSIEEVNTHLGHYRESWGRTGCSILADEWTTDMGKTLINFLVYCPEGTLFLKSMDVTGIVTSADTLFELLKHVVEEVGEKNVVQVVTNNTQTHALAGKRLAEAFPLFWSPCAARCIDAMLEDFARMHDIALMIDNAKSIVGYIYSHVEVLNLMRKYTNGKDLIVPCETPAATNFVTLKNMTAMKDELRAMAASVEWAECPHSKKPAGCAMANLVGSFAFWASCSTIVSITAPLLRVLKVCDSKRRPAMGYVYAGLYQAKEVIKQELASDMKYLPYCKIIDGRSDRLLPCPLYAAGFFLNPLFFSNIKGEMWNRISSSMLDCIERLVPEAKMQDKIQKELNMYKSGSGDFGRKMAVRARNTLLPAEWWSTYGGGCPSLTRMAIRILSQTCSARGPDRKNIPFEQMHNQRVNYLEHQRLSDLVFVSYNLRLWPRQQGRSGAYDPIAVDNINVVDDWVMDRSELLGGPVDDDSSWMALSHPVGGGLIQEYPDEEDAETFISGLDLELIQGAFQGEDDDEVEEEVGHHGTSFDCKF